MLVTAMYRNEADDRRTATITQANAVGIGFGGDKAYQAWLKDQREPAPAAGPARPQLAPTEAAVLAQKAAIMRLQSLFSHQRGSSGLRNAIRGKAN